MRLAAFTVDVDRDVNLPVKGKRQAVSKCHESEREEVRFESSIAGLVLITEMLEEMGLRATFFFEGDTLVHIAKQIDVHELMRLHEVACHGVCHEDITGEDTGIPLSDAEVESMLTEGRSIIERVVGREPSGFRAPYQHIDLRTLDLLSKKGFIYDSSITKTISQEDGSLLPWRASGGLLEIPVAQGWDARGKKIVSYLWPMHEGRRTAGDYLHMARSLRSGVLVLSTHAWHLMETYSEGHLRDEAVMSSLKSVRSVLEGVEAGGFELLPLVEIAREWEGRPE